ncbi:unnamed protein product, partial [Dovyalis caffra]
MEGGALLGFDQNMNYGANLYNDRMASMRWPYPHLDHRSKLHDPALHRILHKTYRELFEW